MIVLSKPKMIHVFNEGKITPFILSTHQFIPPVLKLYLLTLSTLTQLVLATANRSGCDSTASTPTAWGRAGLEAEAEAGAGMEAEAVTEEGAGAGHQHAIECLGTSRSSWFVSACHTRTQACSWDGDECDIETSDPVPQTHCTRESRPSSCGAVRMLCVHPAGTMEDLGQKEIQK